MKGGVPNSVRSEAALRAKLEPVIPSDTRDTVKILVKYRYIQNYSEFFFKNVCKLGKPAAMSIYVNSAISLLTLIK